jgi:NTE family protein
MPRVGLVLGAGGLVGQAYHAGVLAALENELGWDPRTASLVIGTSAGSLTATLLRMGVSAEDMASWSRGRRMGSSGANSRSTRPPSWSTP